MRALLLLMLLLLVLLATRVHALPDLTVDAAALAGDVHTEVKIFAPEACELQPADRCLGGPGTRKLLRFAVLAVNVGDADLVMGTPNADDRLPTGDPTWVFSACPSHNHWHFVAFARYELRARGTGSVVVTGQKRSFCIRDTLPVAPGPNPGPRYCCGATERCAMPGIQGMQAGWGDLYGSNLDCQWIDVTDVPPGDYDLAVTINPDGVLCGAGGVCESNPANNVAVVPVTLAAAPAPRVKVKGGRKARRAGRPTAIRWKTRLKGGTRGLYVHDVFYSLDDGATYTLLAAGLDPAARRQSWTVPAGTAAERALVKVVAWSQAGQRGVGVSRPFRIVP